MINKACIVALLLKPTSYGTPEIVLRIKLDNARLRDELQIFVDAKITCYF